MIRLGRWVLALPLARPRAPARRTTADRRAAGEVGGDERRIADRPRTAAARAGRLRAARSHRRPRRPLRPPRGGLLPPRAHVHDRQPGPPAPRPGLRAALQRVPQGLRRPRRDLGRRREPRSHGGQGVREPPRPRAPAVSGQVPAGRLPHRPRALRGPRAPVPVGGKAQGNPRQDLRLRGLPRVLRGTPRPRPACRQRQHPGRQRHRLELLRPRLDRRGHGRRPPVPREPARADLHAAGPAGALPVALGLTALARRPRRG